MDCHYTLSYLDHITSACGCREPAKLGGARIPRPEAAETTRVVDSLCGVIIPGSLLIDAVLRYIT